MSNRSRSIGSHNRRLLHFRRHRCSLNGFLLLKFNVNTLTLIGLNSLRCLLICFEKPQADHIWRAYVSHKGIPRNLNRCAAVRSPSRLMRSSRLKSMVQVFLFCFFNVNAGLQGNKCGRNTFFFCSEAFILFTHGWRITGSKHNATALCRSLCRVGC